MITLTTIIAFMRNPENSLLLYFIAALLIAAAWLFRRTNTRRSSTHRLTINGNNAGIAVSGDVTLKPAPGKTPFFTALAAAANISAIAGVLLAGLTLYLTWSQP